MRSSPSCATSSGTIRRAASPDGRFQRIEGAALRGRPLFAPSTRPLKWRRSAGIFGVWRDGRAVECTGLENRRVGNNLVGSNPTPSVATTAVFAANERPLRQSAAGPFFSRSGAPRCAGYGSHELCDPRRCSPPPAPCAPAGGGRGEGAHPTTHATLRASHSSADITSGMSVRPTEKITPCRKTSGPMSGAFRPHAARARSSIIQPSV